MTPAEALDKCNDLKARFNSAFSAVDKDAIEAMYREVLARRFTPTSCQSCYHDALLEIYHHLKKYGKMAEKCDYSLRAGFIISCPNFRAGTIYTNDNLTNEVAAEYLEMFPNNADMFQAVPEMPVSNGDSSQKRTERKRNKL